MKLADTGTTEANKSADFVVLDGESAMADTLLEEGLGFVLLVGSEADDTRLRLLSDLNLDALVLPPPNGYFVDFTALAAQFGWRRIAAQERDDFNWRSVLQTFE